MASETIPISIHALHEESDVTPRFLANFDVFQSTLSMRRATVAVAPFRIDPHISIHALHEESDSFMRFTTCRPRLISIHALHEESDPIPGDWHTGGYPYFNPRSP